MAVPLTTAMQTQIANLYISILGRNPDPVGFGYWCDVYANANGTQAALDAIASGFGKSPEFTGIYSGQTPAAAVALMYNNILGRTQDTNGAAYWTGIAQGYITSGKTVGDAYALTANAMITAAAANTGTADATLIASKQATAVTAGTSTPVTTYTLTTGIDTIKAGSNSVINGVVNDGTGSSATTLNPGDSITGVAGSTEVLSIVNTRAATTETSNFVLNSIETVQVQNNGGGVQTFNLANASGTNTVSSQFSSAGSDTAFTNVGNIVNAAITNGAGNLSVAFTSAAVAGSADALTLALNGAATSANASFVANGIETINVTSNGTASGASTGDRRVTVDGDAIKAVTVAGTAGARLTADFSGAADGSGSTKVASLNASTATGALDLQLTTGGAVIGEYVSITGGSGNDNIRLATISENTTVSGGAGTDTLFLSAISGPSTAFKNVSNIEQIGFADGITGGTFNLANAGNITGLSFAGAIAVNPLTVQGVQSGVTATYAKSTGQNSSIEIANAATATDDTLNIALGSATTSATIAAGTITASGVENVNITATSRTGDLDVYTASITDSAIKSLTVAGNQALTLTATGGSSLKNIDASKSTANINLNGVTVATDTVTILGGAGNDVITGGAGNDSLVGGSGNDTMTGGAGNDVMDGGDGNDRLIAGGAGNDVLNGGAGNDRIVFANGELTSNDTVDGGAGANTLAFSDALATALTDTSFRNITNIQTVTADTDNAAGALSMTLGANALKAGITTVSARTNATTGSIDGTNAIVATVQEGFTGPLTFRLGNTAGANNITASSSNAAITVRGGANTFTNADTIIGGASTGDSLVISATAAGDTAVLGANVSGFESITISPNSSDSAKAIGLTINSDAILTGGRSLSVSASTLTNDGSVFTFTGSAETDDGANTGRFNVTGGAGNDILTMGAGNDTVFGGAGNDSITGNAGNDSLSGEAGADTLLGGAGNDTILGGDGADQITGGAGADSIDGGAGNDTLIYLEAGQSVAANTTAQANLDTVVGFNAGSGTSTTFVDRFSTPITVTAIGSATIATAAIDNLQSAFTSAANLNTELAVGAAVVVTVSGGTGAGTYLVINTDNTTGYSSNDTVIRLVDATNLQNLTTSNFILGTSTVYIPGVAYTLAASTGAFTPTTAYATADAAFIAGVRTVQGTEAVTDTIDVSGEATGKAVSFNFATGALTGATGTNANNLSYLLMDTFTGGDENNTVTDRSGNQTITLGTGTNVLTLSGGGTDTVSSSGGLTATVSATSGTATITTASTGTAAVTVSGAQTIILDAEEGAANTATLTMSRALTTTDSFLADAADTSTLVLNAAQGADAFTLAAAKIKAVDTITLGATGGVYNLVTEAGNALAAINAANTVLLGNTTINAVATTTALSIDLSVGATFAGTSTITFKGNNGAGAAVVSNFNGGSGIDTVTVNSYVGGTDGTLKIALGGGNDSLTATSATTAISDDDLQIDGGTGSDTLALTQGVATTANGGDIKNIETITVGGNFAFSWTTADADYTTAGTAVNLSFAAAVLENITLGAALSNDAAWTVGFTAVAAKAYSITTDTTAGADQITITQSDDNAIVFGDTINLGGGSDTLTIAQNGKALTVDMSGVGAAWAGIETLVITGAAKTNATTQVITLDKDAGGFTSVNASAATGGITVSLGDHTDGTVATVTLGTGADVLTRTTAGSATTVTLGAGNDTINSLSDTATGVITVTDFNTSGTDVWDFDAGTAVVTTKLLNTGATIVSATAGAATNAYILNYTGSTIAGVLTQTANGGAVEVAIVAGLMKGVANTEESYFILTNGTDSGIYRAVFANIADANDVVDAFDELAVTLVGITQGQTTTSLNTVWFS